MPAMCGIFAAFGPSIERRGLDERLALIKYRGDRPSAEVQRGQGFFLGCQRLAMLDPEQGRQPFVNADASLYVVHNGEIYNHRALRSQLSQSAFQTGCDTELILRWYEAFGPESFAPLSGMFAFCIWDARTQRFYAARDPLGIKPLYYVYEPYTQNFFIASEKKCLLDLEGQIRTVAPGSVLSAAGLAQYAWLEPAPQTFSPEALRVRLEQAVRSQLESDKPLGVLLSGGLDSSAVAYHVARELGRVPAFSVGVEGSEDLHHARDLARVLGLDHRVKLVTSEDILRVLPRVIYHLESYNPVLVRVALCAYLAAELAAREVSGVLVGEGADELFLGYDMIRDYPEHLWPNLLELGVEQLHRTELQRLDRMSMACTLEARLPFLDTDFVRYALGLPISVKLRASPGGYTEKWCLRQAYRGHLPDSIVERRKQPFDSGSGIAPLLAAVAEQALSSAEVAVEQHAYPFLRAADRQTVYFFTLWKAHFLRENDVYWADAGRYYARDELFPRRLVSCSSTFETPASACKL